jgi:hypothetical protein
MPLTETPLLGLRAEFDKRLGLFHNRSDVAAAIYHF